MLTGKSSSKRQYIIIALLATTTCITVGGFVLLLQNAKYISLLQLHGYLGLFSISLLAGAPLPILIPVTLITLALGGILNPVLVGVAAGLGGAAGSTLTYLTGRGGARLFSKIGIIGQSANVTLSPIERLFKKIIGSRLLGITNRRGMAPVFLSCLFPNPLLIPMVLALGAARFKFMKFLLACLAGLTIQAIIVAYIGHFGLRPLGIFR